MKKKILLTLSLVFIVVCLFAIYVSAEVYNVSYYVGRDEEGLKETVQTDENGTITLRTERFTDSSAPIFNWFTYEGDVYAPGETITVTKDTKIRQFCGYPATNKEMNTEASQWTHKYIQLQEDLYLEKSLSIYFGGRLYIDLNGFNIYSSAGNVFADARSGVFLFGEGSIIHTGNGNVFQSQVHGYDDRNMGMTVGKKVAIVTNGTVFNNSNSLNSGWISQPVPLEFYGNITCNKLININGNIGELVQLVVNPTKLTVLGDALMSFTGFGEEGGIELTLGGSFELTEAANTPEYWTGGFGDGYSITVLGGSFTNGADTVLGFAPSGSSKIGTSVGETSFETIILPGCAHEYNYTGSLDATCRQSSSATYECGKCGDVIIVSAGELAEHILVLKEHEPATSLAAGKMVYECVVCKRLDVVTYTMDPSDLEINVVVYTEDEGERYLSIKIADVFVLEKDKYLDSEQFVLVDLKGFDIYEASDIIAIEIPSGISSVNFATDNESLKSITVLDNASITFESFARCKALEEIIIGKSTVYFMQGCSNNVIRAIRSDKEGANVTFAAQVFDGKTSLEELTLSSNSNYDFGANSFRRTSVKELILPDYCEPFFRDEAAFYNCAIEYLYVGRGITKLMGKPFDYCQKMQKIILMEVTSFSHEYTFCVENQGEKPVEVYIHSEEISLPNNTFYQCHGIIVYTNAPITNTAAFNGCTDVTKDGLDYPKYTIIYGIPHKYEAGSSDPTCTSDGSTGYVTDCPCGVIEEAEYQRFVAAMTNTDPAEYGSIETTVIPALGHLKGNMAEVVFLNGILEAGVAKYDCDRCFVGACYEESVEPIIKSLGYSVCEYGGALGIAQGYVVDTDVVELYETVNEGLSLGMVACVNIDGNTQYPMTVRDGNLVATEDAIVVPISAEKTWIETKLVGITDAIADVKFIVCLYVFDGVNIKYISNGGIYNGVVGDSYNSLMAENK